MLPPTYKGHTEPVGSATYFAAYGQISCGRRAVARASLLRGIAALQLRSARAPNMRVLCHRELIPEGTATSATNEAFSGLACSLEITRSLVTDRPRSTSAEANSTALADEFQFVCVRRYV